MPANEPSQRPIARRLERWSRRFGPVASRVTSSPIRPRPVRVVLVPPDSSVAEGLRLARSAAASGFEVHFVARDAANSGARAHQQSPGFPDDAVLVCTELEAYLPPDKAPFGVPVAKGVRRWLGEVFGGAFPDIDAGGAMQSSAMQRLALDDVLAAWPLVLGLTDRHPGASFVCSDPSWLGFDALEAAVRASGGTLETVRARPSRARWSAELTAFTLALGLAAVGRRALQFRREAPCRARLQALRQEQHESPTTWIGVIADWPFSSRHLIEAASHGARVRGTQLGVVFQSTFQPGHLTDAFMRQGDAKAVFPVLDLPSLQGITAAVDQCVAYERWRDLARGIARSSASSARALGRLLQVGPHVSLGPCAVSLHAKTRPLALLLTQDVLRGREASFAAEAFARRLDPARCVIAWSHASRTLEACADLTLQRHGVRTCELLHGALAETQDFLSSLHSNCQTLVLWTQAEAAYLQPWLDHACVGGYPLRPPAARGEPRPAPSARPRVLILSNYATFLHKGELRELPREHYQRALFDAVGEASTLLASAGKDCDFRWRPHPADEPTSVAATLATCGANVQRSRETSLQDDLAWADVVLASVSTTVVEALLAGVPVFVHEVPIHEEAVLMALFDDDRRFDDGAGLAAKLGRCLDGLGDGGGLAPETRLRVRFFGPSRTPLDVEQILFGEAARLPAIPSHQERTP